MIPHLSFRPFMGAAAMAVALATFTPAQEAPDVLLRRVQSILQLEARGPERTEAEVLEELVGLGSDAAPLYFALYAGGPELEALYRVDGLEPAEVRWWGRPDHYGELVARALVERLPESALETLAKVVGRGSSIEDRLAACHLSSRLGTGPAFELWLEVATGLNDDEILAHITRVSLRNSLAAHLAARPENYELLAKEMAKPQHPIFLDEASQAIERDGNPRGIHPLISLLDMDAEGILVPPPEDVIPRIDKLSRRFPWILGVGWKDRLSTYLTDEREPVRMVATTALEGRTEAFDELLGILEDGSEPRAMAIAQRALAASFELGVGMPVDTWVRRVERELEWWEVTGREYTYTVADLDTSKAGRFFRELARKPAFHQEIAAIVAENLVHMQTDVARGALAFLAELNQPSAAPWLVESLTQAEQELEGEIAITLTLITGLTAGRDPQAWKSALAL